jgi:hypothetical protein
MENLQLLAKVSATSFHAHEAIAIHKQKMQMTVNEISFQMKITEFIQRTAEITGITLTEDTRQKFRDYILRALHHLYLRISTNNSNILEYYDSKPYSSVYTMVGSIGFLTASYAFPNKIHSNNIHTFVNYFIVNSKYYLDNFTRDTISIAEKFNRYVSHTTTVLDWFVDSFPQKIVIANEISVAHRGFATIKTEEFALKVYSVPVTTPSRTPVIISPTTGFPTASVASASSSSS